MQALLHQRKSAKNEITTSQQGVNNDVRNEGNQTVLKNEDIIETVVIQGNIPVLTEFLPDVKPRNPRHSAAIIRAGGTCTNSANESQEEF